MNNSPHKVVVINGLQNNLNIPLKKPGLHKEFGFFCVRHRCSRVWLSFGIKFEPRALETKNVTALPQEIITRYSWTLLVKQRERLPASVAGSSVPSVLNFIANFDSGKLLDTEIKGNQCARVYRLNANIYSCVKTVYPCTLFIFDLCMQQFPRIKVDNEI